MLITCVAIHFCSSLLVFSILNSYLTHNWWAQLRSADHLSIEFGQKLCCKQGFLFVFLIFCKHHICNALKNVYSFQIDDLMLFNVNLMSSSCLFFQQIFIVRVFCIWTSRVIWIKYCLPCFPAIHLEEFCSLFPRLNGLDLSKVDV